MGVFHQAMALAYREATLRGEADRIPVDVLTNACAEEFRLHALKRPLYFHGPQSNYNAAATDIVIRDDTGPPVPSLQAALADDSRLRRPLPQQVHQIWLGTRPVPEHFRPWMAGVEQFAEGWDYRLWRDADLPEILPDSLLPEILEDSGQTPGLRADILRYEILRQQGACILTATSSCCSRSRHCSCPAACTAGMNCLRARPSAFWHRPPVMSFGVSSCGVSGAGPESRRPHGGTSSA